jgi:hypothetical protein
MPKVSVDWTPADPEEDRSYPIDFAPELNDGEFIEGAASAFIEVVEGSDADAATRIYGSAARDGTIVWIRARGLVAGVIYRIGYQVATSQQPALRLWSHVACIRREVAS